MTKSPWGADPTLDQRLIALRGHGYSFLVIARLMGMTRNSVIGRAQRIKLAKPDQTQRTSRQKPIPEPDPEPDMPKPEPFVPANPIRLVDAPYTVCRWILDGYAEPTVCGEAGFPWCIAHRPRIYSTTPPRRERAA